MPSLALRARMGRVRKPGLGIAVIDCPDFAERRWVRLVLRARARSENDLRCTGKAWLGRRSSRTLPGRADVLGLGASEDLRPSSPDGSFCMGRVTVRIDMAVRSAKYSRAAPVMLSEPNTSKPLFASFGETPCVWRSPLSIAQIPQRAVGFVGNSGRWLRSGKSFAYQSGDAFGTKHIKTSVRFVRGNALRRSRSPAGAQRARRLGMRLRARTLPSEGILAISKDAPLDAGEPLADLAGPGDALAGASGSYGLRAQARREQALRIAVIDCPDSAESRWVRLVFRASGGWGTGACASLLPQPPYRSPNFRRAPLGSFGIPAVGFVRGKRRAGCTIDDSADAGSTMLSPGCQGAKGHQDHRSAACASPGKPRGGNSRPGSRVDRVG